MFRAHPTITEFAKRDYGTVCSHEDATLVDIPITPVNSERTLLTVNDIKKITQITVNELIASNNFDTVTRSSLHYVIALTYKHIRKHVRPQVSQKQLVCLTTSSVVHLIEHYNRTGRTREQLLQYLNSEDIAVFVDGIVAESAIAKGGWHRKKKTVGCFSWMWNLFGWG